MHALRPQLRYEIRAEEYEVVEHCDKRQQIERERCCYHFKDEERSVDICKPLDFDRNNEHEKDLGIRIKRSKGEEHRKIDVVRSDACRLLGDKIDHHAVDDGEQNTGEDEYIKSRRAPLAFERAAYPVIKIEKQQRPHARILRNEHKRDKAPYLSF